MNTPPPSSVLPPIAIRDLSVLSYACGFTYWCYRAPELAWHLVDMNALAALGIVKHGDVVLVSAEDGAGQYFVDKHGPKPVLRAMISTPIHR